MFNSIVLPLDGSSLSERAVPLGALIARRSGAQLELVRVHVHDDQDDNLATITPYRYEGIERASWEHESALKAEEQRYLAQQGERVNRETGGAPELLVIDGPVSRTLTEHIRQRNADLVVMSTRARSDGDRTRVGRVANHLLHRLKVPLLLLHTDSSRHASAPSTFKHVMIVLDGSEAAEQIIDPAFDLAHTTRARVTIFSATTRVPAPITPSYLNAVADNIRARGLETSAVLREAKTIAQGVVEYAQTNGVDLIAIAGQTRSGIARVLRGSVADEVLRQTNTALLVLKTD